jgi:phosphatidylglycerophosphate synthase
VERNAYLAEWSARHGGFDPGANRLVGAWLALIHAVARRVVRLGLAPDVLTLLGVACAAAAAAIAAAGGHWALVAATLVLLSGLLDGLDGAVAVLTGTATRFGSVLDSLADRVGEVCYLLALYLLGAPGWSCLIAGCLTYLQEYARARAAVAGMTEIRVVTVAERPTRVAVTAAFLASAGLFGAALVGEYERWAIVGAGLWAVLAAVGLVQLLVTVRRCLR